MPEFSGDRLHRLIVGLLSLGPDSETDLGQFSVSELGPGGKLF